MTLYCCPACKHENTQKVHALSRQNSLLTRVNSSGNNCHAVASIRPASTAWLRREQPWCAQPGLVAPAPIPQVIVPRPCMACITACGCEEIVQCTTNVMPLEKHTVAPQLVAHPLAVGERAIVTEHPHSLQSNVDCAHARM
jgi:hypothetical protein